MSTNQGNDKKEQETRKEHKELIDNSKRSIYPPRTRPNPPMPEDHKPPPPKDTPQDKEKE